MLISLKTCVLFVGSRGPRSQTRGTSWVLWLHLRDGGIGLLLWFTDQALGSKSILNVSQEVLPTLQSSVVKISWLWCIIDYNIGLIFAFSCNILLSFNFKSAQIFSVTKGSFTPFFITLTFGLDFASWSIEPWLVNWLGEIIISCSLKFTYIITSDLTLCWVLCLNTAGRAPSRSPSSSGCT